MKRIHDRKDLKKVYIIFRVFNIGSKGMGMRVYVDPEELRLQEDLVFTGEHWSVTPGPA